MDGDDQSEQQQQQQFPNMRNLVSLLTGGGGAEMISSGRNNHHYPQIVWDKLEELAGGFLEEAEDAVHELFSDNKIDTGEDCSGFDSDRDTEQEISAIVKAVPRVLSRRFEDRELPIHKLSWMHVSDENDDGILRCNIKAVSFIPILAQLGIDKKSGGN